MSQSDLKNGASPRKRHSVDRGLSLCVRNSVRPLQVRWYLISAIQSMGGHTGGATGSLAVGTAGIACDARLA